jgi:hypothetical protein
MTLSNAAEEEALHKSLTELQPLDAANAESVLREAKQIMDGLGVVFFLRQGTCLGAIRDSRFIPWDDDVDIGSVIGLHGLTEGSIDRVVAAFRDRGFISQVQHNVHDIYVPLVKSSVRIDWNCSWIFDDGTFHYPGVRIPVRVFTELKEIDFVGEKFLVPNPPEAYLRFKYGADWMTPNNTSYVKDVVQMIPEAPLPGYAGGLRQSLTTHVLPWRTARLRVLDHEGEPVSGAEVVTVGLGRFRTNKQGYAKLYLPRDWFYALIIRYDNHEEVLYEEQMRPGGSYVYRPDPSSPLGRLLVLSPV